MINMPVRKNNTGRCIMEEARKEVGEIIDRLAVIYDEEDVNSPDILREIERLGARLKELTGKTIEDS